MQDTQVINLLSRLNGNKIYLFGNHDKVMHRPDVKRFFSSMHYYLEIKHNDELFCMMHYPIGEWNKAHHGSYHIHGHCHGNYKAPNPCRIMDVGAPCINYTPISLDDIVTKLKDQPLLKHGAR